MNKIFLINDTLVFDPARRSLYPLAEYPQRGVLLHGPSSECLLRLLEHNNQVISQKYLFAEVWEKQGAVVTTNTLYQNIASVRKGLKSAGLEEDIIKTMPKIGFKCLASVREGEISDFIQAEKAEDKTPDMPPPPEESPAVKSQLFFNVPAWLIWGIVGLLTFLSWTALYLKVTEQRPVYQDYSYIGEVNGCRLYSSYPGEDKSTSIFTELGERYPLDCKSNKTAYLTINRLQLGLSLLLCNSPIKDNPAHCKSYFFREGHDEEE